MNKFIYFLSLFILFNFTPRKSLASDMLVKPVVVMSSSKKNVIKKYNLVYKKYFKELCSPGSEEKFWRYMRQFSGNGFYVPTTLEKKLDMVTVNRFIPELERKKIWIDSLKEKILNKKKFAEEIKIVEKFQKVLLELLEYKRQYFESESSVAKERARIRSKYLFLKLKSEFKKLLKSIPFLLSYRHPNDHFDLRFTYDQYKNRKTPEITKKANEVYFYRKIVQDGAQNPDNSRKDTFLRTAIDSTTLEMSKEWDLMPENLRYDLKYILSAILYQLKKGEKYLISRITEWSARVSRMIEYYKSIKENKIKTGAKIISAEQIIKRKDEARFNLKKFSLKKQAKSYQFWKKQPEFLRAIFVLETILYNEVGALDAPDALERKDVAQVVINRLKLSEYNSILATDSIFPYLSKEKMPLHTNPWLNVLFKEGEFSFTYFFIGGNLRIFCPENTQYGRKVRRRNLSIAYDLLLKPNYDFEAVRYFSRHSMLGRIDMAPIWNEFIPLNERAGNRISSDEHLKKLYKMGKYEYLYHFLDHNGDKYKVLVFEKKTYTKAYQKMKFYKYRNPHYFKYFKKN